MKNKITNNIDYKDIYVFNINNFYIIHVGSFNNLTMRKSVKSYL